MKTHYVLGGGTVFHVRPHLALSAPAYGKTASDIYSYLGEWMNYAHSFPNEQRQLHLTRMAGGAKDLETNADVARLVDKIIADPNTGIVFMSVALCDRQRGHRLGADLFLAKLDASGKKFFHIDPKVTTFDPEGPEAQPAVMDFALCSTGLGCSVVDAKAEECTFYRITPTGQMEEMSDSDLHAYVNENPQAALEMRTINPGTYYTGTIHGTDVIIRLNQESRSPAKEHAKYIAPLPSAHYRTFQVETVDGKIVLQGAKTPELAFKHAVKLLKDGHVPHVPVDLLPKYKRVEYRKREDMWEKRQNVGEMYG